MTDWVQSTVESLGYLGIALLTFLENVFPPFPSEVILPYSGFAAERGELTIWGVALAGMVGSVLGAIPLYYLGKWIGLERLKRWSGKHGHWFTIAPKELDRADRWFTHYGKRTVFFARLVPGVRSLISIPAGMYEMRMGEFLLSTALGTLLWASILAYVGSVLGANYDKVGAYLGPITYVVIGGLALWYIIYVVKRKREKSQREQSG